MEGLAVLNPLFRLQSEIKWNIMTIIV